MSVTLQIVQNIFQAIAGIPKIEDGYNPATRMLEISSPVLESQLVVFHVAANSYMVEVTTQVGDKNSPIEVPGYRLMTVKD